MAPARPTARGGRTASGNTSGLGTRWRPRRSGPAESQPWSSGIRSRRQRPAPTGDGRRRSGLLRRGSAPAPRPTFAAISGASTAICSRRGANSPNVPRWRPQARVGAVEDDGVGLAAVGADLESFGGHCSACSVFPAICARKARARVWIQFNMGWSSCAASDPMMSKQRSISSMSRARAACRSDSTRPRTAGRGRRSARPEPEPRPPNPTTAGVVAERRAGTNSVEDSHDGGVVAAGPGDGDGLVGERLATLEGLP